MVQLQKDIPISQFKPIRELKDGSDYRVDLVQHIETGQQFVLKTFDREKVMQNGARIEQVLNEANILKQIAGIAPSGPFAEPLSVDPSVFPRSLNRLATTTKDDASLCLVLNRARSIDLVTIMKLLDPKLKYDGSSHVFRHSKDLMQFVRQIIVQLVLAFDAMHSQGLIYKDLKATHVFLDEMLRVTLIDFGLSEKVEDGRTKVPAGTLHAMSPEMLILYTKHATGQQDKVDPERDIVTFAHDYYSLGVLILELIDPSLIKYFKPEPGSQQSHIQRLNQYFQSRIHELYSIEMLERNSEMTDHFWSFLQGLLVPDASQRLSSKEAIFAHPFMQQEAQAMGVWEADGKSQGPEVGPLQALNLADNVYVSELHNLIQLSTDEQIDDEENDEEALTEEQQQLFDDF